MEIQCRVSDPSANVTLVNIDTQQPVPCVYDSKRGALGIFTAGTYICKALINGEERHSSEYIVHGWTGVCSRIWECIHLYLVALYPDAVWSYLRWCCSARGADSPADCSAGGRHRHGHLCSSGIRDFGRPLEISWQTGENTSFCVMVSVSQFDLKLSWRADIFVLDRQTVLQKQCRKIRRIRKSFTRWRSRRPLPKTVASTHAPSLILWLMKARRRSWPSECLVWKL